MDLKTITCFICIVPASSKNILTFTGKELTCPKLFYSFIKADFTLFFKIEISPNKSAVPLPRMWFKDEYTTFFKSIPCELQFWDFFAKEKFVPSPSWEDKIASCHHTTISAESDLIWTQKRIMKLKWKGWNWVLMTVYDILDPDILEAQTFPWNF